MVKVTGIYELERDEGLTNFYKAVGEFVGVYYLLRSGICAPSPSLYISKDENEQWNFSTVTTLRKIENIFKLDEIYHEIMPNGVMIETVTSREGDNCFGSRSKCKVHETSRFIAVEKYYEFSDDGMVLTMVLPQKNVMAIRYFIRID